MAKKQVIEEIKQGAPEYMNTYGDMMTLLLCFFVLLFASSNIDAKKFEAIVISFSGSTGVLSGGETLQKTDMSTSGDIFNQASTENMEMENFKTLENKINQFIEKNDLESSMDVLNEEAGLLLRFQDNVLFDSGKAVLKPQAYELLKYIGNLLNSPEFKDKFINVAGHTDNVPINSPKFASNWELSTARASGVVRFFVEKMGLNPNRLSASGYSQYHPVAPNDTDSNRQKNRRVDIMVLKSVNYNTNSVTTK